MNPDLNVGESRAASLSPTGLRTISEISFVMEQYSNLAHESDRILILP